MSITKLQQLIRSTKKSYFEDKFEAKNFTEEKRRKGFEVDFVDYSTTRNHNLFVVFWWKH